MKVALTYDDIQLVPNYSVVRSRTDVDLTCQVSRNYSMPIPLVASCMDTVCGYDMMMAMAKIILLKSRLLLWVCLIKCTQ